MLQSQEVTRQPYHNFMIVDKKCLGYLKSLIRPILDLCSGVWDLKTTTSRTWRTSKTCSKTRHWHRRSKSSEVLGQELEWPLLSKRRAYLKLCLCWQMFTGGYLVSQKSFFPHTSPQLHHCSNCLKMTTISTFFVSIVPMWNALPDRIISMVSDLAFKWHLE